MKPSVKRLREFLSYNPKDGLILWIKAPAYNKQFLVGKEAGSLAENGYVVIKIFGKIYGAHRIAWALKTGKWPSFDLDHKDTKRANNKWANLRRGGYLLNARNRRAKLGTKFGLKGIFYVDDRFRRKPFAAKIVLKGKTKYLGYFHSPEEAHAAYCKAAKEFYGSYARAA